MRLKGSHHLLLRTAVLLGDCRLLSEDDNSEIQRGYHLTKDSGLRGWRNRLSHEDFISWYSCFSSTKPNLGAAVFMSFSILQLPYLDIHLLSVGLSHCGHPERAAWGPMLTLGAGKAEWMPFAIRWQRKVYFIEVDLLQEKTGVHQVVTDSFLF